MAERESVFSREELKEDVIRRTRESENLRETPAYVQREKEKRRDRVRGIIVGLALLVSFFAAGLLYYHNYPFTTYSVDSEMTLGSVLGARLYSFGDGNLIVGGDTLTYVARDEVVFTVALSLAGQQTAIRDDYFAVLEKGGYRAYICDRTGILSSVSTTGRIRGLDISESGVLVLYTENGEAGYVTYYDRYGQPVGVEVKTELRETGYPVRIAVSPDGQRLLSVYYSVSEGLGESSYVLYDFRYGKEENSYVIDTGKDYYLRDSYLADCCFLGNDQAYVIGDNVLTSIAITKGNVQTVTEEIGSEITAVFKNRESLGIILKKDVKNTCTIYGKNGTIRSVFEVPDSVNIIAATEDYAVFGSGKQIAFYNISGKHRYSGSLVEAPVSFAFSDGRSLLVNTGAALEKITYK